jgi:tetratricopeptide (TPR) repeat protein
MSIIDGIIERLGMNAYALGDYGRAEKWLRRLEKREPDSMRVLRNLAVVLLARGDFAGAERYLLREEALYGATYGRHRALADQAYSAGRREEASARYSAALAAPEASRAPEPERRFLETRLALCGDPARFAASRKGIERFAEGEAARERGDSDAALAAFLEAAELDPTHWPALNNAGTILLERKGGAAAALGLFEKAAACASLPAIERNAALARELAAGAAEKNE